MQSVESKHGNALCGFAEGKSLIEDLRKHPETMHLRF